MQTGECIRETDRMQGAAGMSPSYRSSGPRAASDTADTECMLGEQLRQRRSVQHGVDSPGHLSWGGAQYTHQVFVLALSLFVRYGVIWLLGSEITNMDLDTTSPKGFVCFKLQF